MAETASGGILPRYSEQALPAYRFMPGRSPHPSAHPQGHSFGRPAAHARALPASDWRLAEAYLFGCDLYNRSFFWEAHEAWEALWQVTRQDRRQHRYLQGLIQAANAQLKLRLGKPRAVERLWAKAERHWQEALVPDRYMGLALASWRIATGGFLADRLPGAGGLPHSADPPPLLLQDCA